MATYIINFEHTKEIKYQATVEAESYEDAMDVFEEDPFNYVTDVIDNTDPGLYNVSKVVKSIQKEMYSNNRELQADYV